MAYASSPAAGETLATALSGAGVDLTTATSDIMTAWRTSHDTAATQLTIDRATAMTTFSTALQSAESGLDNAIMTAATTLFVNVSSAAETRANTYAEGLETYSAAVTGAFTTFAGTAIPAVKDYGDAERTTFENLIHEVHAQRVSAVDAWRIAEGTNWATYVDAVADADQAYGEDAADAQTASIGSVSISGVTYHESFIEAEADAATEMAAAIRTFTTDATATSTAFEQAAKQDLLDLTSNHNTARGTFLTALAQQNADAEADAAGAMSAYNADVSAAQATLQTAVAEAADALTTAIAAADRAQSEDSAEALQTYREADVSAVQARDTDVGEAMKTLGDAEADAAQTHATSIYGAWHTQRTESLELDRTYEKDVATAATEFTKAVEPAKLIMDHLDASEAGAYRTARGAVPAAYAQAETDASAAQHEALAGSLNHWKSQVSNGMSDLDFEDYAAYRTIADAALESLEPTWWGQMIPIFGAAYSAANNYSKGNYFWGTVDAVFAVGDVFAVKAIVTGLGKLGAKAASSVSARQTGKTGSRTASLRALKPMGCFVAGTLVWTSSGPAAIENVRPGDQVWAYNHELSQWELDQVGATHEREVETDLVTVKFELADGSTDTITATGNHPFWVESGDDLASRPLALEHAGDEDGRYVSSTGGRWVEARHLALGDRLLAYNSESATVIGLQVRTERLKVYNLTVLRLRNYAVGEAGVAVHNNNSCLAGSLIRSGSHRSSLLHEAHHIVAWDAKAAKPGLQVLKKFGIDVHSHWNGVWLRGTRFASKELEIVHRGRILGVPGIHSTAYYRTVNKLLSGAGTRSETLRVLQKIRFDLLNGTKFW